SDDAWRSSIGSASSMRAHSLARFAGSGVWPASRFSSAAARNGTGFTPVTPTAARSIRPWRSSSTTAATPTTAKPDAVWPSFVCPAPRALGVPGGGPLGEDLAAFHRRGEPPGEELRRRDLPLPLRAGGDRLAVERQEHRGPVGRGIGVHQAAADGAAVAHLHV